MLKSKPKNDKQRVRLTTQLTWPAYLAAKQLQQRHRALTGSALPLWRFIDAAVNAYARQQGIKHNT